MRASEERRRIERNRGRHGDAGQVGQHDAGGRQGVSDAPFEIGVLAVQRRLQLGSRAEIGARGHDAEAAGHLRHAHGVGGMRGVCPACRMTRKTCRSVRSKIGSQSNQVRPARELRSFSLQGEFRARVALSSARMPMALTIRPPKRGWALR